MGASKSARSETVTSIAILGLGPRWTEHVEWAAGLDDPRYNQCTPNCYLPRRLFGEYLHWVYQYLCRRLDRFCKVALHKTSAKDVIHRPDQTLSILYDDQTEIDADFLFMATGHSENYPDERDRARIQFVENNRFRNRYLQYVMPGPAPIHTHFKDVPPGETVAIEEMGLTAIDAIEVDDQLNLVTSSGESVPNAWALGTVSEGSKFYTYIVPRPCVNSTALVDAGRSVTTIFRQNLRPPLSEQDHEPGKLSAMGA